MTNVRVKTESVDSATEETVDQVLDLRKSSTPKTGTAAAGGSYASHLSTHKGRLCSWCGKRSISAPNHGLLANSGTWTYCSERCYEQYRRDVFKRRAACLWCSNLNAQGQYLTSVSVQANVDESKFCSDYCLNQFKLKLFMETVESETTNLQLKEPHGARSSLSALAPGPGPSGGKDLITPAMWLSASGCPPGAPPTSPPFLSSTTSPILGSNGHGTYGESSTTLSSPPGHAHRRPLPSPAAARRLRTLSPSPPHKRTRLCPKALPPPPLPKEQSVIILNSAKGRRPSAPPPAAPTSDRSTSPLPDTRPGEGPKVIFVIPYPFPLVIPLPLPWYNELLGPGTRKSTSAVLDDEMELD